MCIVNTNKPAAQAAGASLPNATLPIVTIHEAKWP